MNQKNMSKKKKSNSNEFIPRERKKYGAFYSPETLIDLIIQNTLVPLIKIRIQNIFHSKRESELLQDEILEVITKIKILDPSMGSGLFLFAACKYLLSIIKRSLKSNIKADDREISSNIIENCVYGIDIDREAVNHVRSRFKELLMNEADNFTPDYQVRVDSIVNKNFQEGDALLERMFENKFDIIIGNPPWGLSYENTDINRKDCLGKRFPQVNDYETYQFFSIRSLELLKEDGYHAFIVPNTMIRNVLATKFRRFIITSGSLLKMYDYTNIATFDDPKVRCLIYIFQNKKNEGSTCEYMLMDSLSTFSFTKQISIISLEKEADWNHLLQEKEEVQHFITIMESESFKLGEIVDLKQGYIPYRLSTLSKRFGKEEAIKIRDQRLWHAYEPKDPTYKRELRGRDISRYGVHWSGLWVKYGRHVSTYIDPKYFTNPRLLIREITNPLPHCLTVTYSDEEFVNNPSIIGILKKDNGLAENYSIYFLLALLNSKAISLYFHSQCPKAKKGLFPKIIIQDVRKFPVPSIEFNASTEERTKIFNEWRQIILNIDQFRGFLGMISKRILPKDVIHDLIAFLAKILIENQDIDSKKEFYEEIIEYFICKLYGIDLEKY